MKNLSSFYDSNTATNKEIPSSLFSFLFAEVVQYVINKQLDEKDFDAEEKLSALGYPIVL